MSGKSKRVVIAADMHCGSKTGLTHPDFDAVYPKQSADYELMKQRRRLWNFYKETIDSLKPIDVLLVNGDAIDGKGKRSGGTELLTTDRNQQIEMAGAVIAEVEAGDIVMSYGTAYHTGEDEDWEDGVADDIGALKIGAHDWIDVNGLIFDYKHYIGSSSVPYGRHTQIAKENVWNLLWNEHGEYPRGDVFIRSHVHYYAYCGGVGWFGLTTPALQGYGSKFGTRKMQGTVDFGLVSFDVVSKDEWEWTPFILKLRTLQANILKL